MPFDLIISPWIIAGGVLLLLLIRGLWIIKVAGDDRIAQKKAMVKAREGRNPEDAVTYEQDVERQAIAYIKKIPVLRRVVERF